MKQRVCIVLDTNFILRRLEDLTEMYHAIDQNQTFFMIPLAVIQELDALKNSPNLDVIAGQNARKGSRFLNEKLVGSNDSVVAPKMVGQSLNQTMSLLAAGGLKETNDDKILECCVYCYSYLSKVTVLLTMDINLAIKAKINSIATIEDVQNMTWHGLLLKVKEIQKDLSSKPLEGFEMDIDDEIPEPSITTRSTNYDQDIMMIDMNSVLLQVNQIMLDLFSPFILAKLEIKYPQQQHLADPLPWNLDGIFILLEKEYGKAFPQADFPPYYPKSALTRLKTIAGDVTRSVRQSRCILTKGDLAKFIRNVVELFVLLPRGEANVLQGQQILLDIAQSLE